MSQIELPSETFVLLLEKLEIKTNKPNISKITLLPSEQVIQLIEDARHGNAEAVIEHIRSWKFMSESSQRSMQQPSF